MDVVYENDTTLSGKALVLEVLSSVRFFVFFGLPEVAPGFGGFDFFFFGRTTSVGPFHGLGDSLVKVVGEAGELMHQIFLRHKAAIA